MNKKRKIRIAHLRASNFFGGPEKQIAHQTQLLNNNVFVVQVITYRERNSKQQNEFAERLHALGIPVILIEDPGRTRLQTAKNLFKAITIVDADILCCHEPKSILLGLILSRFRKTSKVVVFSRGWTHESWKVRQMEKVERYMMLFADHVVAVSFGQREKILALGIKPERVSVIHNAVHIDNICKTKVQSIRKEYGLPEGALIVASAGRLSPEKNYAAMIRVAQEVTRGNNNIYFIIFGEGFMRRELDQAIADGGLNGHFLLPGFRNDLQEVLHDIDIFMLPSFTEGLPNVILEAFAAGKPVVASAVGGTPEVVQDGISGFLSDPRDIASMVQAILKLAGDPILRRDMGTAGHRYVAEHFGFEAQTRKYEELYKTVAKSRSL